MTNQKTKKFIKGQIMRLRAKLRIKKLERKSFLDSAFNFSQRANVCSGAISYYENRIFCLENEEEFRRV
tara:strand:+ start:1121 stop:1327 length:207 start_codon:yes stop_codon:yes gene_type:complete